tara:strand:- start:5084 stop:5212 length:129 start_codon:yes stop_codon:yes gene_type:complete
MAARKTGFMFRPTKRVKRKGVHSKNASKSQSKFKKKSRGQGS